jgi:hypothetical protein
MEFYSTMKKNGILLFPSTWMELENIILAKFTRLRNPKTICSPLYADFRSKTNAVILLNLGHTLRGGHIQGGIGKGRKPKT